MQDKTLPEQDDRRLLAEISRWRKANGWSDSTRGWINEQSIDDARVAVKPDTDATDTFRVTWRRGNGGWHQPVHYAAVDIQQAVDLLVALYILPLKFSSAYTAGVRAGRVFADTDRLAVTR